jgi:hypothetical protein
MLAALVLPDRVDARQAEGGAAQPMKRAHHLFRPTPPESMREMATDRPDQTESPYTVDGGHLQLEMDFVNATIARGPAGDGPARLVAWSVAPFNVKVGLLDRVDLQFVIDTYARVRVEDPVDGEAASSSGFGNVATRLKVNLWGNDGGRTALGMMAYVRWPLPASGLRNGRTEGGLIVPLALSLGRGWNVGVMTEVDVIASPSGGHETQLVNSMTAGHALTGTLGMYAEVLGAVRRGSRWLGQLDVGWTYALRDAIQLDWGCNVGLTATAPSARAFAGISVRF